MAPANKTQPGSKSVAEFLTTIEPEARRADVTALASLIEVASGHPPVLWGGSIIGFGTYHYRYESGREGDYFRIGLSSRKTQTTLYLSGGFDDLEPILARLGKHSIGKSCLHIKQLSDVKVEVLDALLKASWAQMAARYPI